MTKVKLTTTILKNQIKKPNTEIQDTEVPGLKLKVGKKASTFNFEKRIRGQKGSPIQVKIGRYPTITLDYARTEARRLAELCERGIDPRGRKVFVDDKQPITLNDALAKFLKEQTDLKERTKREYRSILKHQVPECWLDRDFRLISPDMIAKQFHSVRDNGVRSQCWKFLAVLSSIWNGVSRHFKDSNGNRIFKKAENPAQLAKELLKEEGVGKDEPERIVIKDEKLGCFITTVEKLRDESTTVSEINICNLVLLSLFTGFRFVEAQTLRWEDIDLENGFIHLSGKDERTETAFTGTKNHQDHSIPLSTYPWDLLKRLKEASKSPYVFPSVFDPAKPVNRDARVTNKISEMVGFHFSPHSTRRTLASVAHHVSIGYLTIKRMLNHSTKTRDVTGHYIRDEFSTGELRKAFQTVCDYMIDSRNEYRSPTASKAQTALEKLKLYAATLGFDPETVTARPLLREVV